MVATQTFYTQTFTPFDKVAMRWLYRIHVMHHVAELSCFMNDRSLAVTVVFEEIQTLN